VAAALTGRRAFVRRIKVAGALVPPVV